MPSIVESVAEPSEEVGKQPLQVDRATAAIEEAIANGDLRPGERIQEQKLAKKIGLNRGAIREALQRLEGRSLIVRTPNQGARIASLTPRDVIELFELREVLEGLACRLASEEMTASEVEHLEELMEMYERGASAPPKGYFQNPADRAFHFTIAQASRNNRLFESWSGLYNLLGVYQYHSAGKSGRGEAAKAEHRHIVDAILCTRPRKGRGRYAVSYQACERELPEAGICSALRSENRRLSFIRCVALKA